VAQAGSLCLFTTLATRLNTLRLTTRIARLNGLGVEVESPGKEIEEQEHDGVSFSGYAFMLRVDSLLLIDLGQFSTRPTRGRTPQPIQRRSPMDL
jgi:hypothetical protein